LVFKELPNWGIPLIPRKVIGLPFPEGNHWINRERNWLGRIIGAKNWAQ